MKFLRYPGGKGKLVNFLEKNLPAIKGHYIEPFVGGGALFLHLQPQKALLADTNKELVDLYNGIKNYPHKVWECFSKFPSGKISYYKIRNMNTDGKPIYHRAARILYLNRTCFKGMWRHSADGNFNVGYGGEDRRWVITHENIIDLSKILRNAIIVQSDFSKTLNVAKNGDFVFLDPPYGPGEREPKHAHYITGQFSFKDQVRLSESLKNLSKRVEIKWMMTNSSHPDIKNLYRGFYFKKIRRGTGRIVGVMMNNPQEILISNYKI